MLRQNAPPQERRLFVALGGGAIACVVKGRFTTEDIAFTESKQWLSSVVSVISAVETFLILVWNRAASDAPTREPLNNSLRAQRDLKGAAVVFCRNGQGGSLS